MGHSRLGDLPRTREWAQLVKLIACGALTAQVARATMLAAERGLNLAADDPALQETVYLLMQLPLAARSPDYLQSLKNAGLDLAKEPTQMELVGAFSDAVDAKAGPSSRTDLGEMAHMAAAETLTKVLSEETRSLFAAGADDVRHALHRIGTTARFGDFSRQFFARLANRVLDYYLSRTMANQTGPGRRFATLAEQGRFNEALSLHCHEASLIVEDFSGDWFSRTNWTSGGISREDARKFAYGGLQKLVSELKAGARRSA